MLILKTSDFRPAYKQQVNFYHPHNNQINFNHTTEITSILTSHTKCQSICMLTRNTSHFRPAFKNQANLVHPHNNQTNISLHWNQVKFDPSHWNHVNLDQTKNNVHFHAHTKNKWFLASIQVTSQFLPHTQPNQFHSYTEIKLSSIAHTEITSISTTITKPRSIFMLTVKTSNFRSEHKNKINFDPRTKNMSISVLKL